MSKIMKSEIFNAGSSQRRSEGCLYALYATFFLGINQNKRLRFAPFILAVECEDVRRPYFLHFSDIFEKFVQGVIDRDLARRVRFRSL
jgi:hypothetical protein